MDISRILNFCILPVTVIGEGIDKLEVTRNLEVSDFAFAELTQLLGCDVIGMRVKLGPMRSAPHRNFLSGYARNLGLPTRPGGCRGKLFDLFRINVSHRRRITISLDTANDLNISPRHPWWPGHRCASSRLQSMGFGSGLFRCSSISA